MLNRRQSLQSLLAVSFLHATRSRTAWADSSGPFQHGVASGDPDHSSVVIWTRLTTPLTASTVRWEMADDTGFKTVRRQGEVRVTADRDHTVKVVVRDLPAGGVFHYRFIHQGVPSPVGRTRTLPKDNPGTLGIALASCSNYAFGYFNAYAAIARDEQVHYVLHTGDYLYEYGAREWGFDTAQRLGRLHDPVHETVTLADYRRRHAQYKADPDLQAMHAAHPLLACWDDHESANNPWTGGAQNHQQPVEGKWSIRRAAATRAYYEWMPVRDPARGEDPLEFWRTYRFGGLATLVTLETRHTGRSQQIDYAAYRNRITDSDSRDHFMKEVLGAPGRTLLSARMEAVLTDALRASADAAEPWRLIGNAIPLARMCVPDLDGVGALTAAADNEAARELRWKGQWNLPFYTDTWDGYPWARERFFEQCRAAGAMDLLVLTGDSHSFWVNRLVTAKGESMGIELGTAGITSPGDFVDSGFDESTAGLLDKVFMTNIPDVDWTDNLHQGYVQVVLHAESAIATFFGVTTLERRDPRTTVLNVVRISRDSDRLALGA
jgi:alkaline phosphatase D